MLADTLCSQWRSGLVAGSLCDDFCSPSSSSSSGSGAAAAAVVPSACQAAHFGKEVVFAATWAAPGEVEVKDVFVKAATHGWIRDATYSHYYTIAACLLGGENQYSPLATSKCTS